jgi:membrane protein YqaA with SNARE-associated domain
VSIFFRSGMAVDLYLVAALQWGILAPLNLVKLLRNATSPWARHWVPQISEECQRDCGIARMWALLFWSSQLAFAAGYLYINLKQEGKVPFVYVGIAQKVLVGAFLLRAYAQGTVLGPIGAAGAMELLMALLLLRDVTRAAPAPSSPGAAAPRSGMLRRLQAFAGSWWFPWLVGAFSGLNVGLVMFTAPITFLFLSAVWARPDRRYYSAVANAIGTTVGAAAVVYLVQTHGVGYLTDAFPQMFAHEGWGKTKALIQSYGPLGVALISAMPIALQPIILFATLAEINPAVLVGCILVGRTVKYSFMAWSLSAAPALLGYLGIRKELLDSVKNKAA